MAHYRTQSGKTREGLSSVIASATAPASPHVGQRWFNTATGVTYQWTTDGASNFWLDVSSGGIGTSANRGIDIVGDIDPHKAINPSGGVGSVYYNREKNRHFVCTDATSGANVWSGRYAASGGTTYDYLLSGTYYRVHKFLTNDTFRVEDAMNVDYLVVAGGGGGGGIGSSPSGGGGGAGGFRTGTGLAVTAQNYVITVGGGGQAGGQLDAQTVLRRAAANGGNSSIGSLIVSAGGGRGGFYPGANAGWRNGETGGSGGGSVYVSPAANGNTPSTSPSQGNNGGAGGGNTYQTGGGGGGAGAAGAAGGSEPGAGGVGEDEIMGLNAANSYILSTLVAAGHVDSGARYYAGGGGAGKAWSNGGSSRGGYAGLGGGGAGGSISSGALGGTGNAGTNGTGGGGGGAGGHDDPSFGHGGAGGSGIILIRYPLS